MNFTEAVAAVIDITARPDRLTETENAVNSILSYLTIKGDFARDLVDQTLTVDPTLYAATISTLTAPNALVRFRKIKYLKPTGAKFYLTPTDVDKIFQAGNTMQPNVFCVTGTNITYTLGYLTPTLEIGYYQYPAILTNGINDTHWMLDMIPWTVVDLAAAKIYRSIGDDDGFRQYQAIGLESFQTAKNDFQDSVLYGAR